MTGSRTLMRGMRDNMQTEVPSVTAETVYPWEHTKKNNGIDLSDRETDGDGCRYQKKEDVEICLCFSHEHKRGVN